MVHFVVHFSRRNVHDGAGVGVNNSVSVHKLNYMLDGKKSKAKKRKACDRDSYSIKQNHLILFLSALLLLSCSETMSAIIFITNHISTNSLRIRTQLGMSLVMFIKSLHQILVCILLMCTGQPHVSW